MKKISVVLPVRNEEINIPLIFEKFVKIINEQPGYGWEIIFVNDGSLDNSEKIIKDLAQKNKFIKMVSLSRNFGHQEAISAGLDYSSGDAVITMDADLQDPPELCPEMIKEWEKGFEVIYAKRRTRKDSFLKKITAYLFYRFLKKITFLDIPMDAGDFRLMDRKAVNELKKFREKNRFLRGLSFFIGFKHSFVIFDRNPRLHGNTKYSFKKMFKLAINGIVGFSDFPPKLIGFSGFVIFIFGILGIASSLIGKLFSQNFSSFYSCLIIASIFFVGGLQIIMQGINSEYSDRIYTETLNRPLYIVRELTNFENQNDN